MKIEKYRIRIQNISYLDLETIIEFKKSKYNFFAKHETYAINASIYLIYFIYCYKQNYDK